jgi:dTDP-4-amino-4,6-dideoxygalactose transaminase
MIRFSCPSVSEVSTAYALDALNSDHHHGDGPYTAKAEERISKIAGGGRAVLTPSCTHALEMASMLIDLGPGDEVLIPSYTFTSAATATTKFGATPVFVDSQKDSPNLDLNLVEKAITPNTKAISWVNYAGQPPNIDGIKELASEYDLVLIEDNAHGLGGSYKEKPLGSFGDFATQSFHATKNIQCGEGGALIINNEKYLERAEIIREKGTNRKNFSKGEVKKYTWVDQGSSYLLAEVCAAILLGQLEDFENIQRIRQDNWRQYFEKLNKFANVFTVLKFTEINVAHMFALLFKNESARDFVKQSLHDLGVQATSHYEPLDRSPAGIKFGRTSGPTFNADRFSKTILRLPLWSRSMDQEILGITNSIEKIVSEMPK